MPVAFGRVIVLLLLAVFGAVTVVVNAVDGFPNTKLDGEEVAIPSIFVPR